MGRATAHPNHQCISSEDIHGTEVYGPDGKNIGEIDHLIIDKVSGRVAYAVMSFGGFTRPNSVMTRGKIEIGKLGPIVTTVPRNIGKRERVCSPRVGGPPR